MTFNTLFALLTLIFVNLLQQNRNLNFDENSACSTVITSGFVSYKGCEESVSTKSLTNPKRDKISIFTFKGIPYAEPPIGSLRFQKPEPKIYNKRTTVNANHYQHPCMQPFPLDFPLPHGVPSEDCLFLNIWTPTINSSANLPVMIWIHGGRFVFGSGTQLTLGKFSLSNMYSGDNLVIRGVIVVTVNYRLGVFGFLYGDTPDCPGNMGLWDQALALNWVKQNINAFGGNPNDITLFGESAGSISVSYHIVSPVTRNLFNRAIMQSGSGYTKIFSKDKDSAYATARRFATNSLLFNGRCNNVNNWIECLRNKSAKELLFAQTSAIFWNPSKPWQFGWFAPFQPIYGDEFIPNSIPEALEEGNFRTDIKILIGHNEMEGLLYSKLSDLLRSLLSRYEPRLPRVPIITKQLVYNDIKNIFIDNDTIGRIIANKYTEAFNDFSIFIRQNPIRKSAVHSLGDYILTCPTVLFGGHMVSSPTFTGKVFQYRLTYANSQSIAKKSIWAEVTHTDDLPLVFGQPFKYIEGITWSKNDKKLSKGIMDIWTHFVKFNKLPLVNGNVWPEYSLNADNSVNASYLELHADENRMGRVYVNRYDGNDDGFKPSVIGNCFSFWDEILRQQF